MELSIVVVQRFDSRGKELVCTVGPFQNGDAERWCERYNAVLGRHDAVPGAKVLPIFAPMDAAELAARQVVDKPEAWQIATLNSLG